MLGGGVVPGSLVLHRRRARHRQVDAAAAGGGALRADGRSGAVQLGRGVRAPDQVARRAAGRRAARRSTSSPRPASSASSRRSRGSSRRSSSSTRSRRSSRCKFQSAPGSIGQVREAATQLLFAAKGQNIPTFLVGHVTKDGNLAGPEGPRAHRRHGAVLRGREASRASRRARGEEPVRRGQRARRLRDDGQRASRRCRTLRSCSSPSGRRTRRAPRCSAASKGRGRCSSRCRRSSAPARYGNARRMASGLDQSRLSLLLAVLEKRAGLNLMAEDVFVNVAGGMAVDEPAADLGVVAAVASSVRNRPVQAVHGRVRRGRAGRRGPRRSRQAALRVREAAQMGFTRCIVPHGNCAPGRRARRAASSSGCKTVSRGARRTDRLVARL